MPLPGPSSSDDQKLGECTVLDGLCILITPLVPATPCYLATPCHLGFLGAPREQHLRYAVCLLWGADANHPASQEDVVRNWVPAHSLVEDAISGALIAAAPCLLALAVTCLPLCLQQGRGLHAAILLSFGIHSIPCSASGPGCQLEPFMGKSVVVVGFFLSPCQSHSLDCYLMLPPSDCPRPQVIQTQSLPQGSMMQPVPPSPALTC